MRRKNRNFNNAKVRSSSWESLGKASCLLLLLLIFLAVNPISSASVFAEGDSEYYDDAVDADIDDADVMAANVDDDTATLSANIESTIGVSFSPITYYASLSPTSGSAKSAQINALVTVNVQNSGGYAVYLKGNSTSLVGRVNSSNTIAGATTAKTYASMDTNTWGYYAKEGNTVPDNATYKAISISNNGDKIAENTDKQILSDTKTIAISFAAKVDDTKPADTYSNTMMLSVVSSPRQLALDDIDTMQEMTTDICGTTIANASKQLRDERDGKYYWVGKLADGKCWMTQNLDLDLNASTTPLTSATSDVTASWTPSDAGLSPAYTETVASSSTIYSNATGQRSWSLGDYRVTNPNSNSNCGSAKASAANCTSQFTTYSTPTSSNGEENAHYILGNHYQWNTATAGTGGSIISGQAASSICPKGWRLPTSGKDGSTSIGEFATLVTALGDASPTASITNPPFYAVRGGRISQSSGGLFNYAGSLAIYSTSTPGSGKAEVYYLSFGGLSDTLNPSAVDANTGRQVGYSVRCIAR